MKYEKAMKNICLDLSEEALLEAGALKAAQNKKYNKKYSRSDIIREAMRIGFKTMREDLAS